MPHASRRSQYPVLRFAGLALLALLCGACGANHVSLQELEQNVDGQFPELARGHGRIVYFNWPVGKTEFLLANFGDVREKIWCCGFFGFVDVPAGPIEADIYRGIRTPRDPIRFDVVEGGTRFVLAQPNSLRVVTAEYGRAGLAQSQYHESAELPESAPGSYGPLVVRRETPAPARGPDAKTRVVFLMRSRSHWLARVGGGSWEVQLDGRPIGTARPDSRFEVALEPGVYAFGSLYDAFVQAEPEDVEIDPATGDPVCDTLPFRADSVAVLYFELDVHGPSADPQAGCRDNVPLYPVPLERGFGHWLDGELSRR